MQYEDIPLVEEVSPRFPWLAWGLIVLVVAAMVAWQAMPRDAGPPAAGAGVDRLSQTLHEKQAQLFVGLAEMLKQQEEPVPEANLPEPRGQGSVREHVQAIIVVGELHGPQKALEHLEQLDRDIQTYKPKTTEQEDRLLDIVGRLYDDYANGRLDQPSLTDADREFLREQLGWFGELALAPGRLPLTEPVLAAAAGSPIAAALASNREEVVEQAMDTFMVAGSGLCIGAFLGLAGLVSLIVLLVLAGNGRISSQVQADADRGPIYAETFALWLLLWVSGTVVLLSLGIGLAAGVVAGPLSLLVLAWPVQRGIPWTRVRQDIGLTWGRRPVTEAAAGLLTYIMALPLLVAGAIVLLMVAQALAGPGDDNPFLSPTVPSHPAVELLVSGDWDSRILLILLAVVIAPVVEEIMFRGVLHYHLRGATWRWQPAASILFSGTVTSFIFAAIHPQGLLAIPVLMALAYAFTLAREWRGTLVPCMIAHGLSNGIVFALTLAIFVR